MNLRRKTAAVFVAAVLATGTLAACSADPGTDSAIITAAGPADRSGAATVGGGGSARPGR